jgi:hypothetical protein
MTLVNQAPEFEKVMALFSNQTAVKSLVIAWQNMNIDINERAICEGISHVLETLNHFGLIMIKQGYQ